MNTRVAWLMLSTVLIGCQGEALIGDSGLDEIRIDGTDTPVHGDPEAAALRFIEDNRHAFAGLSADDEFTIRSTGKGRDGLFHVRVHQRHRGVRVWGAAMVVHVSGATIGFLNGNYAKGLDRLDVDAVLSASDAHTVATKHFGARTKGHDPELLRKSSELVVTTLGGNGAKLAWHEQFYTELQGGMAPGLWNYFIDALDGEILFTFNGIHTLSQASGAGGNPKVPRTWVEELDVEPSGSAFAMNTARLVTTNMNNSTSGTGTVVVGPLADIGDAAINDAHGFAEATLNMMSEWLGYNSIDNNGFVIKSRVHYGSSYENAFWDGTQMTYGDGASTFYALSGDIDVVGHEINHGFTTFHSDLTYSGMSGGLNESFSDVAGKMVEFYRAGDGADWDIGRDIFQGDDALRFMCDPPLDGGSIGDASDYTSGLDVHYSSGVMNKAFCRAAKRLGSGDPDGQATAESVRRAGRAFFLANESYWTASTNFTQGCQGVMDAATALGMTAAERDALLASWLDVGVYCDGEVEPINCDTTITSETGTLTSPNYPSAYPNNTNHTWCIQPASGGAATLTFTAFDTESGYDVVHVRDATGELSSTSGTTAPPPVTATLIAVTFTSDGSVTKTGFAAEWSTGATPNQPPVVSLTAPAPGTTVSGNVTITATASDPDGSVSRVTLSLPDGSSVDLTSSPYAHVWDSTSVANGAASISAVAYDNDDASSTPGSVAVTIDNAIDPCDETLTAESGTFTSPGYPSNYPDNVATTWCIQPASGAAATLTFDAFNTETNYDFVEIKDASGAVLSKTSGTTAPPAAVSTGLVVTFTSDSSVTRSGFQASWSTGGTPVNQPPSVAITAPADGATVGGVVSIVVSASDVDGTVASVALELPDGSTVNLTSTPFRYSWNSAAVADGAGAITAIATDDDGAASTADSITVNIDNSTTGCIDGSFVSSDVPIAIPDNNATGVASDLDVTGDGNVASLTASVNISHTYRGDLRVTLVSPSGTRAILHDQAGSSADNLVLVDVPVTAFTGETAAGLWRLEVADLARADTGTLNSWSLDIVGDCGGGGAWSASATPNLSTIDNGQVCTSVTVVGSGDAADVLLDMSGTHDWRAVLRGTLEHNGVVAEAFPTSTFPSNAGSMSLTDRAVAGFGGSAAGVWTLCIIDTDAYGDTGVLSTWGVHN